MTDECTLMVETELPIMMTVADATPVTKGSWLIIANPMTMTVHAANDESYCGGIAAEEKIANDGKTKVAVYQGGIFRMTGSAAITTGETLALSGTAQRVKKTDATCFGMKTVGMAFTDCGGAGETFIGKLQLGVGLNA